MNRPMLASRLFLSTFLFGALVSGPNLAHANNGWDSKYWGGALCVPYGNTSSTDYSVRGDGIQNLSATHDRWVVCPMTRDSESAMGPQGSASIDIGGTRAAAGSIDCMLTKGDANMPPMATLVHSTSYGAGIWNVTFSQTDLYSPGTATLTVTCRLPPKAQLSRVRISENNSTDPDGIP